MAELPDRLEPQKPTKGISIYSIVSAQAGGISDAVLRAKAGDILEGWKGKVDDALGWNMANLEKIPKRTLEGAMGIVYTSLTDGTKLLIDAWKAGLGLQVGTAFMGLEETHMGFPQLLSMYKLEQLEALVRPRLTRYWQSKYVPNVPNSALAFRMLMHGRLSKKEFNQYALEEGWDAAWHDKLYDVFSRNPDEYMAFSMWKRGLIKEDQMKLLFRMRGYDAAWDPILTQALHRRPSFRELTTLADFVPLPDLWVREVLRAGGLTETDITYAATAIAMRPLREEVRSLAGRYAYDYQIGRMTYKDLEAALKRMGILPTELKLWLEWAARRYKDEVIDEQILIIEQRVNRRQIWKREDIIKELTTIGVLQEKANLIAELFYWKYVAYTTYYRLYIWVNDPDMGTTDPAPGTASYTAGRIVKVYGDAAEGYHVDHWELDGEAISNGQLYVDVEMDADHDLECVFASD